MELSQLVVYPVKSCAGLEAQSWELDARGLRHDRSHMVVDAATGVFLTQREEPALAVVRPELRDGRLRVTTPGGRAAAEPRGGQRTVRVWEHTGAARDCGDAAAELLGDHLRRDVRLVALSDDHARTADPTYAGMSVPVGFSDGFPLLVVGEASLEDLNSRLERPLPMNRFRPNLVIAGSPPFAEDDWRDITVGGVGIRIVKPCTRCRITTVDQDTGRFDGGEPLRTLGDFRRGPRGVLFGQNAVHTTLGVLRVGDAVQVP